MKNSKQKAIISFGTCSQKKINRLPNRNDCGQVYREHLTAKGQLFVIVNFLNDDESGHAAEIIMNIITDVYYSDPSDDVMVSLKHAFQDVSALIQEMFNDNGNNEKTGISCTALILTQERVTIAQMGENLVYRITPHKIEKLNWNNMPGKSQRQNLFTNEKTNSYAEKSVEKQPSDLNTEIEIDFNQDIPLNIGDGYLLCTDSLINTNHQAIKNIVLSNTPEKASRKLINLAKESGSKQNINVQVIRINPASTRPFLATLKNTKTVFRNKKYWFFTASLLLLVFISDYKLSSKLQTQEDKLLNLIRLKKTDISLNYQKPSTPGIANIHDASVFELNTEQPGKKPARLTSEDEKKTRAINSSNNKTMSAAINKSGFEEPLNNQTQDKNSLKPDKLDLFKGMLANKWDFQNLTQSDYKILKDKAIFLDSPERKKVIFQTKYSNLNFQVQSKVIKSNLNGRYGIIVGYNRYENSPHETYYLFSIHKQKQYLLQKYSNFKKELIASIPIKEDSLNGRNDIQLKVIVHGAYLELYANQEHLYVWEDKEKITGSVGLFVDPQIQVEFSNFKSSNSYYFKKNLLDAKKLKQ